MCWPNGTRVSHPVRNLDMVPSCLTRASIAEVLQRSSVLLQRKSKTTNLDHVAHATGNKPPPLSRTRRRTLTTSQPQPQCRLLSRLSPELRLLIWEYVLGSQRLHIIQRSGQRLGHVVCPLSTTSDKIQAAQYCEICIGAGIPQPAKEGDLCRGRNGDMLLGLALTCRQMYV